MKKWQIESSKTSEILEISEKLFRVFLFPSFLVYSQIRKLGFKNLGKKFPRFPRYPRSPNFRLGRLSLTLILSKVSTKMPNSSDLETRKSLRNCSITISFTSSITSRFLLRCCQELFPKTCFICGKYQIQRYDKERKKMYSQKNYCTRSWGDYQGC